MRLLSTIAAAAALAFGSLLVSAQTAPAYPALASQHGTDNMCRLDGLSLSGGLTLNGGFNPGVFSYTCGCIDWTNIGLGKKYNPAVTAHMYDWGSNAQVWFNGKPVATKVLNNALDNFGSGSAVLATPGNDWIVGDNIIQVYVSCEAYSDGTMCGYQYIIVCNKPNGGSVHGDPQFVGLRGQNYQVHGVSGDIYSIVSDSDLQYNSRFVFLNSGECPVVNGKKQKSCWSHPGSYLGELGLKTKAGDKIHLVTGNAQKGFAEVTVNGKEVAVGQVVTLAGDMGTLSRNSTHLASVQVGNWDFVFENSDMFVNQRVRVIDASNLRSHGLLGQTWRDTLHPNAIKYIEGKVDDYVIRDKNIFGDNFVYNAFN